MVVLSMLKLKKYFFLIFLMNLFVIHSMDNPKNSYNIPENRIFQLYGQEGENEKIAVSWQVLTLCSVLKQLIEDVGGENQSAIPLSNFSIKTIALTMNILQKYVVRGNNGLDELKDRSTAEVIDVINCMNFLGVDQRILKEVGKNISGKLKIDDPKQPIDYQSFENMNIDAMRSFTTFDSLVVNVLKSMENIILEKNVPYSHAYIIDPVLTQFSASHLFGIFLHNDQWIVLSSGDTKTKMGNICIYDTANQNRLAKVDCNFVPHKLACHEDKYLVCGKQGGIRIFKIEDINNITFIDYNGPHPKELPQVIQFSPDGKYLVAAYEGEVNNIVIIDMNKIDWISLSTVKEKDILSAVKKYQGAACSFFSMSDFTIASYIKPSLYLINISAGNSQQSIGSYLQEEMYHSCLCEFNKDSSLLAMYAESGRTSKEVLIFDSINFTPHKRIKLGILEDSFKFLAFRGGWIIGLNNSGYHIYDYKTTQQVAKIKGLNSNSGMIIDKDKNNILFIGKSDKQCAMLWVLFSKEEKEALRKCSAPQIMLIQWICGLLAKGKGLDIIEGTKEHAIFMSLDNNLQNLIKRIGVKVISEKKGKKSSKWRPFQ